jgi:hypothetical protein
MTMHLIQGVNSTPRRKQKPKMTKGNLQRWAQEMQQYNKRARQQGDQQLTLDEYIDYVHGKGLPKKRKQEFVPYKSNTSAVYRSTEHIPSADMTKASSQGTKQEPMRYTGERKLMGIATMHKSNMVPVFEDEDGKQYAKDLARMRRG